MLTPEVEPPPAAVNGLCLKSRFHRLASLAAVALCVAPYSVLLKGRVSGSLVGQRGAPHHGYPWSGRHHHHCWRVRCRRRDLEAATGDDATTEDRTEDEQDDPEQHQGDEGPLRKASPLAVIGAGCQELPAMLRSLERCGSEDGGAGRERCRGSGESRTRDGNHGIHWRGTADWARTQIGVCCTASTGGGFVAGANAGCEPGCVGG